MRSFLPRIRSLLSAIAALAMAGPAFADVGGFFPREDIDISVRFENLDDYPNHDFYLKYGLGPGNPYAGMHLSKVDANTWIRLHSVGGRLTEVYLMAVPRGQTAQPPPKFPSEDRWFDKAQPGGVQVRLPDVGNGHRIEYRVSIEGDHLNVVCVGDTAPWVPMSWEGRIAYLIVGLILAAAALSVGMWVRRKRLRAAAVHPKT